jgi:hypothetical protein
MRAPCEMAAMRMLQVKKGGTRGERPALTQGSNSQRCLLRYRRGDCARCSSVFASDRS